MEEDVHDTGLLLRSLGEVATSTSIPEALYVSSFISNLKPLSPKPSDVTDQDEDGQDQNGHRWPPGREPGQEDSPRQHRRKDLGFRVYVELRV